MCSEISKVESELRKEISELKKEIGDVRSSVHRVTVEVLELKDRVENIEETMATKSDVLKILNRFDDFAQKFEVINRRTMVHGHRLNLLEAKKKNLN